MTGGSADFLRALRGLQEAAGAQFTGNSYYQVSNEIAGLIELTGLDTKGVPPSAEASGGFEAMLGEVRKLAEASLSGNNYYMAANRFETLQSFLGGRVEAGKKDASAVSNQKRSFDDLAAASRARVAEMAASLGIPMAHTAPPAHAKTAASLSDGELERRSSEPCSMAELAPPAMAPVAATTVSAKGTSASAAAPKPKQQKTLLKAWLDLVLGRKD